jgi:inhibitor of the pro-sigma K processing machinery
MAIDYTIAIAYGIGILFLLVLGRIFLVPMKVILKLFYNAVIGGIVLVLTNYIGGYFNFHIPFNVLNAFIVGLLGIPGLILLVIVVFVF